MAKVGVACSDNGSSPALPLARALALISLVFRIKHLFRIFRLYKLQQTTEYEHS